jgi:hypothetical protein
MKWRERARGSLRTNAQKAELEKIVPGQMLNSDPDPPMILSKKAQLKINAG